MQEIKVGDNVRIINRIFISAYSMTVNAIKDDTASCSWKEATQKGIKDIQINVPVKDLIHEKHNNNFELLLCLN